MKQFIILLLVLLLLPFLVAAQESFTFHFNGMQSGKFDKDNKVTDRSEQESTGSFVFNWGPNKDVKLYYNNGQENTFRRISGVEEESTDDGKTYQFFFVLLQDGLKGELVIYPDRVALIMGGTHWVSWLKEEEWQ